MVTVKFSKWWLTLPRVTLGSVASLLAATLYQGNPDRINIIYTKTILWSRIWTFFSHIKTLSSLHSNIKHWNINKMMILKCTNQKTLIDYRQVLLGRKAQSKVKRKQRLWNKLRANPDEITRKEYNRIRNQIRRLSRKAVKLK